MGKRAVQPAYETKVSVPSYSVNNRGRIFPPMFLFDKINGADYYDLMGRPPLNVKETKVRLSPETKERIIALVGNYRVAAFIREAVETELARRETERDKER